MTQIDVRAATADDAHRIQAIYAPIVEQTTISFEEVAPTVVEMAERIGSISETYPFLVAQNSGSVVGFAYASQHRSRAAYKWSTDVTVYVANEMRRAGVGRSLYMELLQQLLDRGFHAAFAGIALPNAGSIALHEAVGFKHLGTYKEVGYKFGSWRDVGWWQLLLGTKLAQP
jgi:phosphinothricin acetyltransferase